MEIEAANIDLSNLSLTGENKFDLKLDISVADEKFLYLDQNKASINLNNLSELGEQRFNAKVDKVEGKQLSTEDFTTEEKNKIAQLDNYVRVSNDVNSITSIDTTDGAVTTGITINPNTQSIVLGNDDTQLIDSMAQTAIMRSVQNANQIVVSNDGINITSTNSAGMNISSPTLRYNDNSPNTEGGLMVLDKLSYPFPITDDGQFETVRVGADREIRTMEELFNYLNFKNGGSFGFRIIIDPGTYTALSSSQINVYRLRLLFLAADDTDKPVVNGYSVYFQQASWDVRNITFMNCVLRGQNTSTFQFIGCDFSNTPINVLINSGLTLSSCSVASYAGIPVHVYQNSCASITDTSITNCDYGLLAQRSSVIGTSNCTVNGIKYYAFYSDLCSLIECQGSVSNAAVGVYASQGSFAVATIENLSIDNTTVATITSPPINTNGNYNSYIRRT